MTLTCSLSNFRNKLTTLLFFNRLTRHPLYISPLSTRDFPHRKLILAGDLTRGGKLRRVYLFNDIICWSSDTKRETEVCREVSLAVAYATQKSPTFRRRSFLKSKHENQEKVSSASELEDLIDDADPGTRRDEPNPNLDPDLVSGAVAASVGSAVGASVGTAAGGATTGCGGRGGHGKREVEAERKRRREGRLPIRPDSSDR